MKDIAVVYKHSALESYSAKHLRRHRELNPELGERMQTAHDDHTRALDALRGVLDDLKLDAAYFERDSLRQNLDGFHLVVSLGGDGTFINASHFIEKTLLLGVNSSPENSVGHYCRFFVKGARHEALLRKALEAFFTGKKNVIPEARLLRMQVQVQGQSAAFPVLNDVLFCEKDPAATSRYTLRTGGRNHHQKSSGLWVATPTGSTAAYSSAGGKAFKQKELRFIVRELYSDDTKPAARKGVIKPGSSLKIVSSMMHGALYLDGSHHKIPVALGDHIQIAVHPKPLRAIY
ncbi:MAG: NAD(+)/NADH kinase [Turneriella sp.]|nr:NAD(+)/NADH kinase [Turneriella sp.]